MKSVSKEMLHLSQLHLMHGNEQQALRLLQTHFQYTVAFLWKINKTIKSLHKKKDLPKRLQCSCKYSFFWCVPRIYLDLDLLLGSDSDMLCFLRLLRGQPSRAPLVTPSLAFRLSGPFSCLLTFWYHYRADFFCISRYRDRKPQKALRCVCAWT